MGLTMQSNLMFNLSKRIFGNKCENIAIDFLKQRGIQILHRNYKSPYGEVDIIAQDKEYTVFIEVKSRRNFLFGEPYEAVTGNKQNKIKNTALYYQKKMGKELMIRFDVISIKESQGQLIINHIVEAF